MKWERKWDSGQLGIIKLDCKVCFGVCFHSSDFGLSLNKRKRYVNKNQHDVSHVID